MTKKSLLAFAAAGCLAFAGVMTATALNAPTFYAADSTVYTADPANGSTVDEFPDLVAITFADFTPEDFGNAEAKFTFNGQTLSGFGYYNLRGKTVYYAMSRGSQAPTGNGVLRIEAPEGIYLDRSGKPSPAFEYELNVGKQSSEITVAFTPRNGSTVKTMPATFQMTFEGASSISENEAATTPTVKWNEEDKSPLFAVPGINGNTLTFNFGQRVPEVDPITGDGTLKVSFPAGFVLLDGKDSPAIEYTVTIDSNMVSTGIFTLVTGSYPEIDSFCDEDADLAYMAMNLSQEVVLNTACTEKVKLYKGSSVISSIPAVNDAKEPQFINIEGNMVEFFFSKTEEINATGAYSVVVPAGFFITADGNELEESTAYFMIGAGEFNPADGSSVDLTVPDSKLVNSKNQFFMWNFTPFSGVFLNETERNDDGDVLHEGCKALATLTDSEGTVLSTWMADELALSQGILKLRLKTPIQTNGDYTLNIPEGFFYATLGGKRALSAPMKATVTLTGNEEAPEQTYTLSPEAGYYQEFPTVEVTYKDVMSINVPAGTTVNVKMTNGTTFVLDVTSDENVLIITPQSPITTYQSNTTKYTITVPKGTVTLNYAGGLSFPNNELVIADYQINPCPPMTTDPSNGAYVENFSDGLKIYPHTPIASVNTVGTTKIYSYKDGVRGSQIGTFKSPKCEDKDAAEPVITTIYNQTVTDLEEGEYEIEIPDGIYKIKPAATQISSPKTIIHLFIGAETAVNSYKAEKTTVTVYDANGIKVLENAEPAALRGLAKGFYIINGKKVILR